MPEEEKAFATDYDGPWKDALDFAPGLLLQHTEEPMKYVSFAERQGIEKGALQGLRSVLEAKFGAEGVALLERLGEISDLVRLDTLTREAALARSLDEIRGRFENSNGDS
jgi:hypothetical protein